MPWRVQDRMETRQKDGLYHRDTLVGPAVITYHPTGEVHMEEYWVDGRPHRDDGPAMRWITRAGVVFREVYYKWGMIHRIGAPAEILIRNDGTSVCIYWLYGERLSFEDRYKVTNHNLISVVFAALPQPIAEEITGAM